MCHRQQRRPVGLAISPSPCSWVLCRLEEAPGVLRGAVLQSPWSWSSRSRLYSLLSISNSLIQVSCVFHCGQYHKLLLFLCLRRRSLHRQDKSLCWYEAKTIRRHCQCNSHHRQDQWPVGHLFWPPGSCPALMHIRRESRKNPLVPWSLRRKPLQKINPNPYNSGWGEE